jgi:TLC domain/TRAM1-like protein
VSSVRETAPAVRHSNRLSTAKRRSTPSSFVVPSASGKPPKATDARDWMLSQQPWRLELIKPGRPESCENLLLWTPDPSLTRKIMPEDPGAFHRPTHLRNRDADASRDTGTGWYCPYVRNQMSRFAASYAPVGSIRAPILARSPPDSRSQLRGAGDGPAPRTNPQRARSLLRRWRTTTASHTWVNPLVIMLAALGLYAINPGSSNPLHSALFLSYPLPDNDPLIPTWIRQKPDAWVSYGKGIDDFKFLGFYMVVFTFTREFCMQQLLLPMARRAGILSRSKQSRFMEQTYTALYFSVFGPFGIYVMSRTPVWYFNTAAAYEQYPHRSHEAAFKAYYLLQASYWAQQAIVLLLGLEKPRKDFKVLAYHHLVTLALIWLSYRFHFTYMGVAVFITHDISDFFFAVCSSISPTSTITDNAMM